MHTFILAFLVSVLVTLLIVRYQHLHEHLSGDHDNDGVQKFHQGSIPRIGGVGIALGMIAVAVMLYVLRPAVAESFALLLLASTPAFFGGLVEDFTKRVGVLPRLLLTMLAALLGFWLLGALLSRSDVELVDAFLAISGMGLLITAMTVAGVANAVNIIDGFNGLASMVSVMILGAMGYVAYVLGDHLLWNVCIASVGAILGFFVWNYPRGLIFLGDGGAYLIGFLIGEVSVLLVARHAEVSPWFPLLLVIYPVFETLFSIYRRKVLQGVSPGRPDGLHLHTLIFRRLVRWATGDLGHLRTRQNSATSPYLWLLCSASVFPALLFWRNTEALMACIVGFMALYVWLYWRIVRFRTPKLMVKRERLNGGAGAVRNGPRPGSQKPEE
ncbi:MraY family glycosyltransferase [Pseudomonas sp. N040]|uniref:MraY family glycosyltransferase n=1 Tax=Pseudomonas sp. N040 TaxID=2785325 RepID=UPI0018A259DC|nr:glycosyltransferase [Pseudomonas sp. N040]MBF7730489.1 glycosyltransferase family 4 protein [Pseudomonas sp. N040]MBW7014132.1 glycosyltransferase [Pseudomonas sp. N040]